MRTTSPSWHSPFVVVCMHLGRTTNDLAVQRMLDLTFEQDGHGLLHLVADHTPFKRARILVLIRSLLMVRPYFLLPRTVLTRAISRRTRRELMGLGQLTGALLHAQVELLAAKLAEMLVQLLR